MRSIPVIVFLIPIMNSIRIDFIAPIEIKEKLENSIQLQLMLKDYGKSDSNFFYLGKTEILNLKQKLCANNSAGFIIVICADKSFEFIAKELRNIGFIVITIATDIWKLTSDIKSEFKIQYSINNLVTVLHKLFPKNIWKEGVIFHDETFDTSIINGYVQTATKENLKTTMVKIEYLNKTFVRDFMTASIQNKIRQIIIMSNNVSKTQEIIQVAAMSKVLQQNYYWIIVNSNMSFDDILSMLTSVTIPNIAVIKSIYETFTCNMDNCTELNFIGSIMAAFKVFAEADKFFYRSIPSDINLCQNKTGMTILKENFDKFKLSDETWSKFQRDKLLIKVFSSKSTDLTPQIPNIFNYSTTFLLSAIYNTSSETLSLGSDYIYLNTFTGWNNKTLYLCSPQLTPALNFIENDTYLPLEKITGIIYEMLKILAVKMQFKPILYEAEDKLWGAQIRNIINLNYSGCVGEIFNGKSLFGASVFTPNYDRKLGIDFSTLFMDESNCATLQFPKPESRIWHIFRPLYWTTWILIVLCLVINSIISYSFSYWSPLSAWNLNLPFSIVDEIRLREHIWNIIGSFLMQGQDFYPYSMSARTVLAVWWLFTIIIFSGYSADLTSFLTVKSEDVTLKTLDQLANRTDLSIIVPKDTIAAAVIEKTDFWVYQKIKSRVKYIQTIDECPRMILEDSASKLVCITDLSPVLYVVKRNCAKMYIIPQTFNTVSMGFAIQYDAPFKERLNDYIRKMLDNGQMEKWINKYWSNTDPNIKSCDGNSINQDSAPPIDLEGVGGVFICTGTIVILSVIFVIFEVLWVKLFKFPIKSFYWQS